MAAMFGATLKRLRLRAGFGLRRFAEMIEMPASNLSAIEHGRRNPPAEEGKLREVATCLGLSEGTDEWAEFFDAASKARELPADIRHLAGRKMIPVLLRTIDNRQMSDEEIAGLVEAIESRPREDGDDS